jgi:hypothetical protein
LSDEKQPEIAMPQCAERGQSAAPGILRGNVAARLVNLGGLYLRNSIDDSLSFDLIDKLSSCRGLGALQPSIT